MLRWSGVRAGCSANSRSRLETRLVFRAFTALLMYCFTVRKSVTDLMPPSSNFSSMESVNLSLLNHSNFDDLAIIAHRIEFNEEIRFDSLLGVGVEHHVLVALLIRKEFLATHHDGFIKARQFSKPFFLFFP